jgi:hypothetical protein
VYPIKEGRLVVFRERTNSVKLVTLKDKRLMTPLETKLKPEEIIRLGFPEIEMETVKDFITMNKRGGILEPRFPISAPQKVLSKREEAHLWRRRGPNWSHEGWSAFYDRYPNAGGILRFSRVGLNSSGTQALVETGISLGPLAGEGRTVFLVKDDDGAWAKKAEPSLSGVGIAMTLQVFRIIVPHIRVFRNDGAGALTRVRDEDMIYFFETNPTL